MIIIWNGEWQAGIENLGIENLANKFQKQSKAC